MVEGFDIEGMRAKINDLRKTAMELKALSHGIPAIDVNVDRILSNVTILEINISDMADILKD